MTQHNDIYDLLNEAEVDSENYKSIEVSEFERQQMMRKFRESKHENKKLVKGGGHPIRNVILLIAAMATITLLQPNFTKQITATVVNYLNDVQSTLSQTLFGADQEVESFFGVSDTEMLGEIPVKLEDLYVTENTISYKILAYYPEAGTDGDKLTFGEEKVHINGTQVELIPSEIMMDSVPEEEGVYQFTHTYYFQEPLDLSGEVNIALELNDLYITGQSEEQGSTTQTESIVFKINTTGEELLANTNSIETDAIITTDQNYFSFEEIALNPGYSRMLVRANPLDPDSDNFYDYSYKFKVTTETDETIFFTQWNSPGLQEDGSHLLEFRYDELNSDISLTQMLDSSALDLQLMRYEGLKASVEEFEQVGQAVTISLD